MHNAEHDILRAECIRTFPSVSFPATLLLRLEEVETGKVPGHSIIAALASGGSNRRRRAYQEAPFDLMYGFRGSKRQVDLLSPFEMIRHWHPERVLPPVKNDPNSTSAWTTAGTAYLKACQKQNVKV